MLAAVAARLSDAQIAAPLHISVRTVESNVSSLLREFGVTDRRALVDRATAPVVGTGGAAVRRGTGSSDGTGNAIRFSTTTTRTRLVSLVRLGGEADRQPGPPRGGGCRVSSGSRRASSTRTLLDRDTATSHTE